MQLTVKQLRRALEDVPDDCTAIAIVLRDQNGDTIGFCNASDTAHPKDDYFYIEGTMVVLKK